METSTVPSHFAKSYLDRTFVPDDLDKTFVPQGDEVDSDENDEDAPCKASENGQGLKWWGAIHGASDKEEIVEDLGWMGRGQRGHEDEQNHHENVGGCRCGDCESDISTDSHLDITQERWDFLNATWRKGIGAKNGDETEDTLNVTRKKGISAKNEDNLNATWRKRSVDDDLDRTWSKRRKKDVDTVEDNEGVDLDVTWSKDTLDVEEMIVEVNPMITALDDTKIVDTSDNPNRKSVIECIHPTKSAEMCKPPTHEATPKLPRIPEEIALLEQYGSQLERTGGISYREMECKIALVGIKALVEEEDVSVEDVMASGVFSKMTQVLVRKAREETKVVAMKTLHVCWEKANYAVKAVMLEELGDLVIEGLAGRGGEVGWQAALFLEKTKLYFQN